MDRTNLTATTVRLSYALYVRKSTESEERQVLSIEAQVRKARQLFPDIQILEVYEDHKTAFTPGVRTRFLELLAAIDKGLICGIIAWHPDRLSRNEKDAAEITYRVRTGSIRELKFCSYDFTNTPEGIMMLQFALSQSQYSSSKLSVDVKRGLEQKLERGERPGLAPVGYINNLRTHTVEADPERYTLVAKMWDYLLSGLYTPSKICDIADREWKLTTLRRNHIGGGPLARSAVYAMFRNPFYTGYFRHNGNLVKGSHPAMIDVDQFNRAQEIVSSRSTRRARSAKTRQFAYTNLIKCGECHCSYTAEVKKGHTYYHCTRKSQTRTCQQRAHIREEDLEKALLRIMSTHTITPLLLRESHNSLDRAREEVTQQERDVDGARRRRLSDLTKVLDGLIDMRAQMLIDDTDFTRRRNEVKNEIFEIEQQLASSRSSIDESIDLTRSIVDLAAYGLGVLRRGSLRKKRIIAQTIVKRCEILDGSILIEKQDWIKPFDRTRTNTQSVQFKMMPARHRSGDRSPAETLARTSDHSPTNEKTATFTAAYPNWQCIIDKVRIIAEGQIDEIRLPSFDALGDVIDSTPQPGRP